MSTEMTPPAAPADRNDETMPITETPFDETAPTDVAAAQPAPPAPPASPAASAAVAVEPAAPRVRGAAIIWGLLFAGSVRRHLDAHRRRPAFGGRRCHHDAHARDGRGPRAAHARRARARLRSCGLVRHAQRRAAASRP